MVRPADVVVGVGAAVLDVVVLVVVMLLPDAVAVIVGAVDAEDADAADLPGTAPAAICFCIGVTDP